MTCIYFNFFTLLLMSWMWQLARQIKSIIKDKEANAKQQRKQYEEYVERVKRHKGRDYQVAPLELKLILTDSEKIVRDFEQKGLSD